MTEAVDWQLYRGPADYRPAAVEPALRSIAEVTDEPSMWAAYNRVLFAVGNNHAGELYAAALPAVTRVAEHLRHDDPWVRRTAGEILTELLAFAFHPDFGPAWDGDAHVAKLARLRPFRDDLLRARVLAGDDDRVGTVFDELLEELELDHRPSTEPCKDAENELPVPDLWRPTITTLVRRLAQNDLPLTTDTPGVAPIPADTAAQIRAYVADYGATLAPLDPDTWNTSVSLWMGDHWNVLVDLWTVEEGASDLVLHLHVYEDDDGYRFEVYLVYVP